MQKICKDKESRFVEELALTASKIISDLLNRRIQRIANKPTPKDLKRFD
jgi:hypothetical protein